MDRFGKVWVNHEIRIRENCEKLVRPSDTLVITGDHSWGRKLTECGEDLDFIAGLPGRKILLRGNHDAFWDVKKTEQLNVKYKGRLEFLQNNFYTYNEYALVGTKGYCFENLDSFEHFLKIQERETQRLRMSFEAARKAGFRKYIVFLHYPPTSCIWPPTDELCAAAGMSAREQKILRKQQDMIRMKRGGADSGGNIVLDLHRLSPILQRKVSSVTQILHSPFTDMAEEYGAEQVIYSHSHGRERFDDSLKGTFSGILYRLVSGDYLNFVPEKLLD